MDGEKQSWYKRMCEQDPTFRDRYRQRCHDAYVKRKAKDPVAYNARMAASWRERYHTDNEFRMAVVVAQRERRKRHKAQNEENTRSSH